MLQFFNFLWMRKIKNIFKMFFVVMIKILIFKFFFVVEKNIFGYVIIIFIICLIIFLIIK
jgi:hypothetical protein